MKILIVDDKVENSYLLETLLRGSGYETITANNGSEALSLALENPPDLIISDILMPVMDGFAFCIECKKDKSLRAVPFVFYTATYTSIKDEEFALSLGADKFILKPQDPDIFIKLIEDVFKTIKSEKGKTKFIQNLSQDVVLKEYNSTLIRKLEDKMRLAEETAQKLRRANEELLKAKEEAEKSDRLKTEFLTQMSHEIRTPMNVIANFANVIKAEVEEGSYDELPSLLDGIELSTTRIIRTIELILNMSEIQIGTYKPIWKDFDLVNDILLDLQREFSTYAQKKGLELNFIYKKEHAQINGDQYSICQILNNILDNSLKYTENGKIDVIISEDQNDKASITIEDTGIGMSEEFLNNLFEPFMQEERGYSRSFEGNGLGLALVKKYCDLNSIIINVKSKKGRGSKVTLTFN
ncbi:MAG: hybrid sensor histidine kinase/response regulator [Bacteroidetes bacterium]|nr:hybrid sensor histidine kinase/response regulator [Bacteroidota bacterium]